MEGRGYKVEINTEDVSDPHFFCELKQVYKIKTILVSDHMKNIRGKVPVEFDEDVEDKRVAKWYHGNPIIKLLDAYLDVRHSYVQPYNCSYMHCFFETNIKLRVKDQAGNIVYGETVPDEEFYSDKTLRQVAVTFECMNEIFKDKPMGYGLKLRESPEFAKLKNYY